VTHYGASLLLTDWVAKVHGLTELRAQALSTRLTGEGKTEGAAEVADFMLLQTLNRYEPLLTHLLSVSESHPESIYRFSPLRPFSSLSDPGNPPLPILHFSEVPDIFRRLSLAKRTNNQRA
jgi:predicted component of type VI protein secretion system